MLRHVGVGDVYHVGFPDHEDVRRQRFAESIGFTQRFVDDYAHCLLLNFHSPLGRVPITPADARRASSWSVSPHMPRSTSSLCSPSVGGGRISHARCPSSGANGGGGVGAGRGEGG